MGLLSPETELTRQAHQRYVSTGHLSAEHLREPVFRAWERCHELGASPRRMRAVQLQVQEAERLLQREQRILLAARPYLRALSQAAGTERQAAMLGDARAIVLDVVGDPRSVEGPESVPGPGSLLSEAYSGANGIGTPIAEGAYVELVGPEHFIDGFHPFTCQGVPVRDADGQIAGVVSISMRQVEAARRLRDILVCAAHGVEAELIRDRLEEDVRRVIALGGRDDEALLEQLRQDVIQSQATARLELTMAARDLAKDRIQYSMRLIALAQRSIQSFARQSALWRDLVSTELGAPRLVELDVLVRDMAALLKTEATMGRIELHIAVAEPVRVLADPRRLSRELLRAFLRVFEAARGGGAVRVAVRQRGDGICEVLFEASPPPDSPGTAPLFITLPMGPLGAPPDGIALPDGIAPPEGM